ncbi:hypothetical protein P8452_25921 [Trifolium repens]|nr:hypothetical protein P8452_25921 [Trifolium repens]
MQKLFVMDYYEYVRSKQTESIPSILRLLEGKKSSAASETPIFKSSSTRFACWEAFFFINLLLIPLTMGVVKAMLSRSRAPGDSEFDEENPQDQNQEDQNQSQPFLTRHSPTFNDGGKVVAGETTFHIGIIDLPCEIIVDHLPHARIAAPHLLVINSARHGAMKTNFVEHFL